MPVFLPMSLLVLALFLTIILLCFKTWRRLRVMFLDL